MSSGKNETADEIDVDLATCGASYCPAQVFGNLEWDNGTTKNETEGGNDNFAVDKSKLYVIAAIYLGCSIAAATIIAIFVDPLSK